MQVPRSPYTNLLDLGVWCSLQAAVEKEHYMKRTDVSALVDSVEKAWDGGCVDEAIGKVWGRLKNVLALVKEGNGGNDLVETKRGKRYRGLDLTPDFLAGNETATPAVTTTASTNADDNEATDAAVITTADTHTDEILDSVSDEDSDLDDFVSDEDSDRDDF